MGTLSKASDITDVIFDSILLVGAPGSGKTTTAAKLFPGQRKLILDIDDKFVNTVQGISDPQLRSSILSTTDVWRPEHKMLSGENKIGITRVERFDKSGNKVPGTEGYVPPNPKGYIEITDFINSMPRDNFPWKVAILDPITAVSEHLIYAINKMHQTSVFTQPLWGVYRANMIELVKGFLSLPCHRVVIVHETEREDKEEKTSKFRPSIQGSYRDDIAKEFTEVYRFAGRMPNGKYMIRTIGNDKYLGRNTKGLPVECSIEDMLVKYA